MTPEELARNICEMPYPESGYGAKSHDIILMSRIKQAIEAAILEEREACASIAEKIPYIEYNPGSAAPDPTTVRLTSHQIAKEIRER